MVGAGDVVADGFRRVLADEDRAGMANRSGEALGVAGHDFQVLGSDRIRQRQRLVERPHADYRTKILP